MSETEDVSAGDQGSPSTSSAPHPPAGSSAIQRIMNHMGASKIEAVLWCTRLFTVFSTINFFLPIFGGNPYSSYQKVLLSNAATSALRLHQRVPNFQLSRAYLAQLFLEDSAHYLFFSLIFVTGSPVSMSLLPVFLYAVLHAQNYTKQLLNLIGPQSLSLVRNLLAKLELQQVNILRFIACNEIFLMPALIFLIFTVLSHVETAWNVAELGQGSILLPFMYYRFLSMRYSSRRNPYCKQLFYELRLAVEAVINKPQCPQIIRNLCFKAIELICRLAPAV